MADGILVLFGGAGYLAPVALLATGAVVMLRPMLPAVHPWGLGALCLIAALTLGLAAGLVRARPRGHRPPRLPRRRVPASSRRGRRRVPPLGVEPPVLARRGPHPVRLPPAGRRAAPDRRVGGGGGERDPSGRGHHHPARARVQAGPGRRALRAHLGVRAPRPGRAARPARARGLRARGARHARGGAGTRRGRALSRPLRRATIPRTRTRSVVEEPEDSTSSPSRIRFPPSRRPGPCRWPEDEEEVALTPMGTEALLGHRVGEPRLPHAGHELPEALAQRAEGGHQGNRARRRPPGGGAQSLQRGRARDGNGHRSARHALRAASRARDQDVQGRHAQGRPGLRPRRRAGPHPRAHPRQAGGGRRGPEPGAQDGAPRGRLPGGSEGLVPAVGVARQGHRGQGHRHRPGQAAAHPHRRHHRLG